MRLEMADNVGWTKDAIRGLAAVAAGLVARGRGRWLHKDEALRSLCKLPLGFPAGPVESSGDRSELCWIARPYLLADGVPLPTHPSDHRLCLPTRSNTNHKQSRPQLTCCIVRSHWPIMR